MDTRSPACAVRARKRLWVSVRANNRHCVTAVLASTRRTLCGDGEWEPRHESQALCGSLCAVSRPMLREVRNLTSADSFVYTITAYLRHAYLWDESTQTREAALSLRAVPTRTPPRGTPAAASHGDQFPVPRPPARILQVRARRWASVRARSGYRAIQGPAKLEAHRRSPLARCDWQQVRENIRSGGHWDPGAVNCDVASQQRRSCS